MEDSSPMEDIPTPSEVISATWVECFEGEPPLFAAVCSTVVDLGITWSWYSHCFPAWKQSLLHHSRYSGGGWYGEPPKWWWYWEYLGLQQQWYAGLQGIASVRHLDSYVDYFAIIFYLFLRQKNDILFLIKVSNRLLITRHYLEIRQHFRGPLHVTVATIHAGTVHSSWYITNIGYNTGLAEPCE